MEKENYQKSTACVHVGTIVDEKTRGTNSPVYTSSAFDYLDVDRHAYPRYFNTPNQRAVSEKIAALEKAEAGLVFSSGMAAISTVLFALLKKGDHAVFQNDLYGGTYHAITHEMHRYGISHDFVESIDIRAFEEKITDRTKLIFIETPSNPLLKIIDIKAIAELAKPKNILTVIDNTFASPINQNPIASGIDVVTHSGTKYLGGHSDICCGAVATNHTLAEKIWDSAIHFGGSLNAQMCALLERSLKTLSLRVRQQNDNAQMISGFLEQHPKVTKVYYPGLLSHPQHELAKSQMLGFGGMLSFEAKVDANDFVRRLQLISSAMSLGGVETTITSPAQTSHSKISPAERERAGINEGLLRISVGIEDHIDIIKDLEQALNY